MLLSPLGHQRRECIEGTDSPACWLPSAKPFQCGPPGPNLKSAEIPHDQEGKASSEPWAFEKLILYE